MRILRHILVLAILLVFCSSFDQKKDENAEYAVKLAMIEKFTHFIDWPEKKEEANNFVVGIYGKDPFSEKLKKEFEKNAIKGKFTRFDNIDDLKKINNQDIIFISKYQSADLKAILNEINGKPILTVSEIDGAAEKGVMINFYVSGQSVRFEINETQIKQKDFKVSSKLMKLAKVVE